MPLFAIYQRGKNSRQGDLVLNGELLEAATEDIAKRRAVKKDPRLRVRRLMAVKQADPIMPTPDAPKAEAVVQPVEVQVDG